MTLDHFLVLLDESIRKNAARHPAQVCFEAAEETGATVEFAGPDGQTLGPKEFAAWRKKGGPDPFVDGDGRATLRIKSSPRITDWVVLNADISTTGLKVVQRYTMLRSWVTGA
jgi:hypothetical protein